MRIVCIIAILSCAACAQAERLTLVTSQNRAELLFQRQDGVLIDQKCKAKLANCLAYQRLKARKPAAQAGLTNASSPATAYCEENEGSVFLLSNEAREEISICAFPDGTMVDAWGLFEKRQKP